MRVRAANIFCGLPEACGWSPYNCTMVKFVPPEAVILLESLLKPQKSCRCRRWVTRCISSFVLHGFFQNSLGFKSLVLQNLRTPILSLRAKSGNWDCKFTRIAIPSPNPILPLSMTDSDEKLDKLG